MNTTDYPTVPSQHTSYQSSGKFNHVWRDVAKFNQLFMVGIRSLKISQMSKQSMNQ